MTEPRPAPARTATSATDERAPAEALVPLRLALAGGGTGGHLVPGLHLLAAARELCAEPLADLVWFTSGRAVEERVLAGLEARLAPVPVERVALPLEPEGGGAPSRSALVLRTPRAVARARRTLARHRTQVLLGLGGFTALPAVLAARSLGIPVVLLEVNATPGAATRWLARFASRVCHAWRAGAEAGAGERHVFTGPPLSAEYHGAQDERAQSAARVALGFEGARPLLVVLGGSQGAGGLNRFVQSAAPALVAQGLQVLHQTGPGRASEGCAPFRGYLAQEYVDPVWRALHGATAVLCRGGASTLAEVAAARVPALVVPYPHHADRHQELNARQLGAGVRIVPEQELGPAVRDELAALCAPAGQAQRATRRAALAQAVPLDAGARIFEELAALARTRRAKIR